MAHPDLGPLLDAQLDELVLICRNHKPSPPLQIKDNSVNVDHITTSFDMIGWHDQHDRKLLEAGRWALTKDFVSENSDSDVMLKNLESLCIAGEWDPTSVLDTTSLGLATTELMALNYVINWHKEHDQELLDMARWALGHGWQRSLN
jgi:hypothetical protein